MLQFFTKKDGAVTVFLVLIMVPVITIATVFVDASRLRMAESVVNSSADLTLQSVMAKYDAELSDYYGLMASAQDAEDLVNKANEYLVTAMTAQGLTADQANSLLATAVDQFSSDEIVDMLQLSLAEGGGDGSADPLSNPVESQAGSSGGAASVVSAVDNGSLVNAAIVKKQIAEFMKYRAPINIVSDIMEQFTNFKKSMELAQEETDLVDKKKTFYETESEFLETAYDIYVLRNEYIACFKGEDISDFFANMKTDLKSYRGKYQDYHYYLVMDLFNSEDTPSFTRPRTQLKPTSTTYSDENQATHYDVRRLINALKDAYDAFDKARQNLDNAGLTAYSSGMYSIQYWVHMMDIMNNKTNNVFTKFSEKAIALTEAWAEYECARAHADDTLDLTEWHYNPDDWEYTLGDHITDTVNLVQSAYNNYITNYNYKFYTIGDKIQAGSEAFPSKYTHEDLSYNLDLIYQQITTYKEILDAAKGKANKIVSKCSKLLDLAQQYEEDFNSWNNAAQNGESNLAIEDRKQLEDEGDLLEEVNKDNVTAMQTRYGNIETLTGNAITDIEAYKYGREKKQLIKIDEFKDMRSGSGLTDSEISMTESTLEANATGTFEFSEPETLHIESIDDSNQPDTDDKPTEFENWLKERFKDVDGTEKEDADTKKGNIEENGEGKAEEEANAENASVSGASDTEISEQSDLPSNGGSDDDSASGDNAIEKANDSISDIVDNFTLDNNLERFYALDYVMSMFTYDTFLFEGMYNNASDLGYTKDVDTIAAAKELHTTTYYNKWKAQAENMKFKADKTLTNKVRSMDTNFSFGNEVEYILYGGTNLKNKASAYGTIYLIRYAMNTAPMFAAGWNATAVNSVATSISALSQGIIPVPLIKVLIILALIAFESAYDIAVLKQGMPVLFVKIDKDDLYLDPSGSIDGDGIVKEAVDEVGDDTGTKESDAEGVVQDMNQFFYSDYLMLFLYMKLTTSEEKVYSRIADVIQVNMIKNTGNDGYRLNKSQVYYRIDANVEMPAFMMKLPINQDAGIWDQMQSSKYQIHYSEVRGY